LSEEKPMKQKFFLRFLGFRFDNRRSKIGNRKLTGVVTLAVAFALCGAVVEAQQPGKIPRIGFLDDSTASSIADRLEAFRQEMSKLG